MCTPAKVQSYEWDKAEAARFVADELLGWDMELSLGSS